MQSYDDADLFLNYLSNSMTTYVMPGEGDISSSYFPQQKLSELIFVNSKETIDKTLFLKSNPLSMSLRDFSYLICSGQNIDNIRKFSNINRNEKCDNFSSIKIIEKMLDWGHLCPCAPDTLRSWPVMNEDPLLLRSIPNICVVGNQKYFEETYYNYKNSPDKAVRIITIPRFSESFSFILFDTKNLNAFEFKLQFSQ